MSFVDVVLIQTCLGASTVVPVCLVHIALLGADPERRCLVVGEIERGDRYLTCLVVSGVYQLEGFLTVEAS